MRVREHFDLLFDPKEGVNNLHAFMPDFHFDERLRDRGWRYWPELFSLALDVMKEWYAEEELKEPFGPEEYAIFRKIVRGGFQRFQHKHKGEGMRVPEIWQVVEGTLARRSRGEPDQPAKRTP